MALINCKECGKEISDQATTCPNCGAKTETAKHKKKNIIIVFLLFLIIATIGTSVYFIKANNPLYKYGYEAINLLKDYKKDKIETLALVEKLEQISNDLQIESNKEQNIINSSSLNLLSSTLYLHTSNISRYYYSNQHKKTSDNQIDEYIKEIKNILK